MRERLIGAIVTAAVLGAGSLVLQRYVAGTRGAAIAMVIAWFAIVLAGLLVALRGRPPVRAAALATFAAVLAATVAVGWWTGFRETEVDEDVAVAATEATGPEREAALRGGVAEGAGTDARERPTGAISLAAGEIAGADGHAGSGHAEVIARGGDDRVLTLTDLDVDPGPDVDVLLSASPEGIEDAVNLGGLKGSRGDQQYAIPAATDVGRYSNVVLWCNPFTVRIAVAELDA
ncbi:MAG TPA: DM13 domain-containing protein [Solirubrobacterales bacterium]